MEGVWRDFYSGDEVDIATGIADGGDIEDCAILIPYFEGWNDWSCVINKVHMSSYLHVNGQPVKTFFPP